MEHNKWDNNEFCLKAVKVNEWAYDKEYKKINIRIMFFGC